MLASCQPNMVAVFPTCVGMNRTINRRNHNRCGVPHMRGDEPLAMGDAEAGV